jgi:SulP family sulfate permease
VLGLDLRTVGDMGQNCPSTLPVFLLPDIPLNWETLRIILPYSRTAGGGRPAGVADDGDDRR